MFAVSKRLIPASRHMSTCLLAPATSVEPTLLKPPCPPKVIVPSVSVETKSPERPSLRYCMKSSLPGWAIEPCQRSTTRSVRPNAAFQFVSTSASCFRVTLLRTDCGRAADVWWVDGKTVEGNATDPGILKVVKTLARIPRYRRPDQIIGPPRWTGALGYRYQKGWILASDQLELHQDHIHIGYVNDAKSG